MTTINITANELLSRLSSNSPLVGYDTEGVKSPVINDEYLWDLVKGKPLPQDLEYEFEDTIMEIVAQFGADAIYEWHLAKFAEKPKRWVGFDGCYFDLCEGTIIDRDIQIGASPEVIERYKLAIQSL
jgi:hypothetical protein